MLISHYLLLISHSPSLNVGPIGEGSGFNASAVDFHPISVDGSRVF